MLVALMGARAGWNRQIYGRTNSHTTAHAHTRTNKRHGRAVAHFRRVRMRSSVSQPSLLHGSYMLNGTHGPSGMIDYNNKGFLDALYTYVA